MKSKRNSVSNKARDQNLEQSFKSQSTDLEENDRKFQDNQFDESDTSVLNSEDKLKYKQE